jgi:predicted CXXCH cytochrome family protein
MRRAELGGRGLRLIAITWLAWQGACASPSTPQEPARPLVAEPPRVSSNIVRSDYIGSEECQYCHAEIYRTWRSSPMRRMNRRAGGTRIQAPFDGSVFRLKNDWAVMEEQEGYKFMRLSSGGDERLYRITKVIGGRYREDFAGIDVTDAGDPVRGRGRGPEKILPVSYVYSTRSWRYKGYSVLVPERPGMRAGPVWAKTCIGCHNTLPYLTLLYDDLHGPGAGSYQGSVSDDLLPASRTWTIAASDEAGLKQVIGHEIERLSGPAPELEGASLGEMLAAVIRVTRRRLHAGHLVEVGIGCEACHGGAREHADDPEVLPTFEIKSPLIEIRRPSGQAPTRAEQVNRTCARCHTVLFSRYPWTWEGGRRADPSPGGSSMNSGEARDFLLGACAREMSCTTCHDPHTEDSAERLREIEAPAGNALCVRCHGELGSNDAVRAHTRHRPEGPGAACVGCHMPKKNMGLGYTLTRYHRIGSPTDQVRVLEDRPLECALCHEDRSVEELVTTMERWWGKQYDRQALRRLYGDDLGVNVLDSTLARGRAHEQVVAIGTLGEKKATRAVPLLAPHLAHEYPLIRYFTKHAIETILGQPIPIDVNEPAAEIKAQVEKWLSR